MLAGLLRQTDSGKKHIRGYGCYFMSLLALWQDTNKRILTSSEINSIFDDCVSTKTILDNDISTTQEGWYRCFVINPTGVFRIADALHGTSTKAHETYRGPIQEIELPANYTIIEYKTKFGSHFVVGEIDKYGIHVKYNPDPNIMLTDVRSVRHWEVE